MECLAVTKLPDGPQWVYEIKLDGYRAVAIKSEGKLNLFSRRHKSFSRQYPLVHQALDELPENTVVDGEIIALDEYPVMGFVVWACAGATLVSPEQGGKGLTGLLFVVFIVWVVRKAVLARRRPPDAKVQ
ncbi:MAG TPA: hypothetical protein VKE24_05145 [Candidatus Acidoferrales bacterium]|nr:hypothetical protein [Candidatus Acidoferrales bacterium]